MTIGMPQDRITRETTGLPYTYVETLQPSLLPMELVSSMNREKRCYAEVDLSVIKNNLRLIRRQAAPAGVMAIVKADAYGHGAPTVARALTGAVDCFGVATYGEAMELRRAGVKDPVLVMGYTQPELAEDMAMHDIAATVCSLEQAEAMSGALGGGRKLAVHLKMDTGMSRIGFLPGQHDLLIRAAALPGLYVDGMFTHLAAADSKEAEDQAYTRRQYALFLHAKAVLAQHGHHPRCHVCNSGGTFLHPEMKEDMVRAGILLYGLNAGEVSPIPGIRPAMTVKATVSMVKEIPAGCQVGYGRSFTAQKPIKIATITAGYADGYPRLLSSAGVTEIRGKPAPVVGRVCMDQLMVDVTGIDGVVPGQSATLLGGPVADTVDAAAEKCGTIGYEIACGVSKRVKRVYLAGGADRG